MKGCALKVTLPWPHRDLNPNARKHWARVAKRKAASKDAAFYMAKSAGATKLCVDVLLVWVTFHPPDNRKRDMDNCIGALKAAQDGVAMAINVNDNKWVPTYAWGVPVRGGKVEMEFEDGTDKTV